MYSSDGNNDMSSVMTDRFVACPVKKYLKTLK